MKPAIATLIIISALVAAVTAAIFVGYSFFDFSQKQKVQAQGGGGGGGETPFGGMRMFNINCTCDSPNKLLYIQDYASNQMLKLVYKQGTSKIYDHQNPTGATYLLGSYTSNAQCRLRVKKYCISLSPDGELGTQPGTGTSQ